MATNYSPDIVEGLRQFRAEHGVQWKAKLRRLWSSGQDEGVLRRARNAIGPTGLDRVNLDEPKHVSEAIKRLKAAAQSLREASYVVSRDETGAVRFRYLHEAANLVYQIANDLDHGPGAYMTSSVAALVDAAGGELRRRGGAVPQGGD
jgi:hypothetical protein